MSIMLAEFLVALICFLSYQCRAVETDSLKIEYHSKIMKDSFTTQRKLLARGNAELVVDSQSTKPKFFICCEPGQFFKKGECFSTLAEPMNDPIFPPIYTDVLKKSEINPWTHFDIHHKYPCKNGPDPRIPDPPHNFSYILENGSIFIDNSTVNKSNLTRNSDTYCLANKMEANRTHSAIIVCVPEDNLTNKYRLIYLISMSVSIPLWVATCLVHACLPELRNIHGLTLIFHVACLCIAYSFFTMIQLAGIKVPKMQTLCTILAFIIYFFSLASFFWLNVMCFDIWWAFRELPSQQSNGSEKRKKLIIYSVYAWGFASLLTGICLIMDFVPGIPNIIKKPQFGQRICWFTDMKVAAIYFYGPAGITIICNLCLFISTAFTIFQHRKNTKLHLTGSDSQCHNNKKQRSSLYLRLFIVMGMNWSIGMIALFMKDKNTEQGLNYFTWLIPILGSSVQIIFIFIVFVLRAKVRGLVWDRICRRN